MPQYYIMKQVTTLLVEIPQAWHMYFHLTYHQRILPQYQTLPVMHPQVIHLTYHQRSLPQFQNLPELNPQVIHLSSHQRSLPQLQILNQDSIPVLNPQVLHLKSRQRVLPQIHIMHQLTVSVYIPPFFLYQTQPKCSRKTSTSIKWTFLFSLHALPIRLQPHSYTWIHWRCFSKRLLRPISMTYLITISTF